MDDSQSSNVFSESSLSCNTSTEIMETVTYDSLLYKTKSSFENAQLGNVSFPSHFSTLLEDCRVRITQGLHLVVSVLQDDSKDLEKLSQYMQDAVDLLQLLSGFIKRVVESMTMSCCTFKTFPTTTGTIIMLVFTHCKNSESIYRDQLRNVQKQLKDLFRTCHELQLTYLMVLEKNFIFDLSVREQLEILIKALNINLKIGEVVQSLDVKTMAEQWKAYMAISEKYSSHLMDKYLFQECTQLLGTMITINLRNATEVDQEEKIIIRSLKVTNFTIKILLKMCSIFKHATVKNYNQIVELLIHIYLYNPAYLERVERKPSQVVNGISSNICVPTDLLLNELITDDNLMNIILTYNLNDLNEEMLLGYVFLIVCIAKCSLHKNEPSPNYPKDKLLHCIIKILPKCYLWLNIGMKFKYELDGTHSIGLFEYLLIHSIGLALTMSGEEMSHLEIIMYEALLGTECLTALFVSSLWAGVSRLSNNSQFLLNQVVSLCQVYQKLRPNKHFVHSPQELHISHTLGALYNILRHEDRIRLFKQFNPLEERTNITLWSVMKINSLPKDIQRKVQEEIIEKYRILSMSGRLSESIDELIQVMKLLSSCSLDAEDVEEYIVQAWMRACPASKALPETTDSGSLWYFEYIQALVSWTGAVEHTFYDNTANLIKVLHVIEHLVKIKNDELNLLLIDIVCQLATIPVKSENKQSVAVFVKEVFQIFVHSSNMLVRNTVLKVVNECDNKHLERIISSISEDCKETWNIFKNQVNAKYNTVNLKNILLEASDLNFVHKCIEKHEIEVENSESVDHIKKATSSNFDFADLDTLFDNASDSEPANKKMKLDSSEAETILDRLETDSSLLCNMKENLFTSEHKRRIEGVCEKLQSLVT